ncbi:poly-beta-hydroxybutyrate polymerase family protein [Paraburkholderia xenovorans LB400]|uniref:Poly-beta-hydroxybutyrate polymerase n=1 Tax=Paraburkholderia xenovorans (strain LB400) TaxID=266265 RepID=Q13IV9_PARXL|nr:alpha/beta fold hydrolase [Paraburkholderia xenovorans]ABE35980.1 Putative poly-beta-hydroxybutyrate polymerase [Paraburkholderia xenovorans LB400]AIP34921.1 poly-beta-hydroxybutyrate polymerase family protein [Paraburkholderia xenovorans LB400]
MDARYKTVSTGQPALAQQPADRAPSNPFRSLDYRKEATIARFTGGLSPAALSLAVADWLIHLASAPGKRLELTSLAAANTRQIADYVFRGVSAHAESAPLAQPAPGDQRFRAAVWQTEPYRFWQQTFLLTEQWWKAATSDIPGATKHHENVVGFGARQLLDMFSPTNFPFTNPEVIQRTQAALGGNLIEGARNLLEDVQRQASGQPPAGVDQFKVGAALAVTPGKVVFQNHLIELIQYIPTTDKVVAEPILIVPAWIMKYYILDLSPHNSLIRFLVGQGYTVFCISWRNVGAEDRDLSLEDYRTLGVMAALDTIAAIVPDQRVHATGYCLGGTLLSIAAAAMAGVGDERLASVSLLAAQTDFTEPGELQLFIDDSEVYFIESMMWSKGYLEASQMSGAFQMLESNDLIWSHMIHDYMLGDRAPMFDLMAWNADSTRMPYRMHSEYLRQLFLDNDLASSRYRVDGRPISLRNLRAPMFVVGTDRDHIAPWRSVYKIHYLSSTEITFVLTSGGHNAGIVSEPGHANRQFRMEYAAPADLRVGPDEWLAAAEPRDGSWWPAWTAWLAERSTADLVAPPHLGLAGQPRASLVDAPGTYVLQY